MFMLKKNAAVGATLGADNQAPEREFIIGEFVDLTGLTSEKGKRLNGSACCVMLPRDPKTGRYKVAVLLRPGQRERKEDMQPTRVMMATPQTEPMWESDKALALIAVRAENLAPTPPGPRMVDRRQRAIAHWTYVDQNGPGKPTLPQQNTSWTPIRGPVPNALAHLTALPYTAADARDVQLRFAVGDRVKADGPHGFQLCTVVARWYRQTHLVEGGPPVPPGWFAAYQLRLDEGRAEGGLIFAPLDVDLWVRALTNDEARALKPRTERERARVAPCGFFPVSEVEKRRTALRFKVGEKVVANFTKSWQKGTVMACWVSGHSLNGHQFGGVKVDTPPGWFAPYKVMLECTAGHGEKCNCQPIMIPFDSDTVVRALTDEEKRHYAKVQDATKRAHLSMLKMMGIKVKNESHREKIMRAMSEHVTNIQKQDEERKTWDKNTKKKSASCAKCGKRGTKVCKRCNRVVYCSKKCQKADWKVHKKTSCVRNALQGSGLELKVDFGIDFIKLAREDPDKYAETMIKLHEGMKKMNSPGFWDDIKK